MTSRILIVGGGISGLATAYFLQKEANAAGISLQYTVVEKESHLGGKVVSKRSDGFVIEGGPDAFLTQKPWALALAKELGLESELIGTNDHRRNVYVLHKGKLCLLPAGWRLTVPTQWGAFLKTPLLSPWGKLRILFDLIIPPRLDQSDESLADFITRRMGREVLDKLAAPIMAGIHIADPNRLSIQSTFTRYTDMERKYGSLIAGTRQQMKTAQTQDTNRDQPKLPMFMSFKGGVSTLIEALTDHLTGQIETGKSVQSLSRNGDDHYRAKLSDGAVAKFDAIVLTTPASLAAKLLAPTQPELAQKLAAIRYISSATISLAYKKSDINHPLDGFGFVVPKTEPSRLLAGTWVSSKFDHRAPDDYVLIRVFVGGYANEHLVDLADEGLVSIVREELGTIMGITAAPTEHYIYRWHKGTPQYDVGHLEHLAEIERLTENASGNIYLTGSSYRGVGLPDCVHQAELTAKRLIQDL
ncbi:MAG: protoporphyrinogen oxidase [Chloroflexota bacterium]